MLIPTCNMATSNSIVSCNPSIIGILCVSWLRAKTGSSPTL